MALPASVPIRRGLLAAAAAGAAMFLFALMLTSGAQAQTTVTLPDAVEAAVITGAAEAAGVEEADVEILRVEAVTWNNGCLGIPTTEACTEALVDGYVAWALAGGNVYRFHTDSTSTAIQGQGTITTAAVATAPLPSGATARDVEDGGDAVIEGDIPAEGVVMFRVSTGTTTDGIATALAAEGCQTEVLAKTVGGQWYLFGYDSPAFANAGFFSADGSITGGIQAGTILLTVCAEGGATPTPSPTTTPTATPTTTATATPTTTATATPTATP